MTADEWFEIEDNGIGGEWTMEDVAKLGPEGREFHRNAPYNPYFPKPDMSIFDEDLYDGYKIKEKKNAGKENGWYKNPFGIASYWSEKTCERPYQIPENTMWL